MSGENDLVQINLSYQPSTLDVGYAELKSPSGGQKSIRVWKNQTKGTGNMIIGDSDEKEVWAIGSMPSPLWVEGYVPVLTQSQLCLSFTPDNQVPWYPGGGDYNNDRVNFTEIDVDFEEDTNQKYGFDEYTDPFVPAKSVKLSDTDTAKANILPTGQANKVYFKSDNTGIVTVSPTQASNSPQTVTLTAGSVAFYTDVWSRLKSVDGIDAARIRVDIYEQGDPYTVAIRVVHEDDDDIQVIQPGQKGISTADICISPGPNGKCDTIAGGDDVYSGEDILVGFNKICDTTADNTDDMSTDPFSAATLQDFLNNTVYNQAVVNWTVTKLSDKAVNFDLNRDGYIDVSTWKTAEMDVVINNCKDDSYNYNIFLVDNPSDGSFGFMQSNQKYGFVHADQSPYDTCTTAHELGHGAFSLSHESGLGVSVNIMTQGSQYKWRLFEGQWDSINP